MMVEEKETKEISFFVDVDEFNLFDKMRERYGKISRAKYFVNILHKVKEMESGESEQTHEKFLLKPDIDPETTYDYLKSNPKASQFIYDKYEKLRPILTELCNPKNPLYIEEVKNELSGIVEVKNEEDKINDLKEEENSIREQIRKSKDEEYKLKSEIKELEKEWEEWDAKLEDINKRKDELEKQVGNLEEPEILKKIKSFNESLIALGKSVFDRNPNPNEVYDALKHEIKLTSDQKNTLKLLTEQAEEIKKLIENEDMLSEFKLSEKRQALKDQIEKEKENAQNELNAFMVHNPQKMLPKIKEHIHNSLDRIEGVREDPSSGMRYYNSHEFGTITSELYDAISNINILSGQVENKSRWGKLKGE